VTAVTAHSPFGETERVTGRWPPYLRLLTAAGMCGLAIALLQLGVAGGLLAWTLPKNPLSVIRAA
jgi:hypothetical protein